MDAGDAARQARGGAPGSRFPWPWPTGSRARSAQGCGPTPGRRTTRPPAPRRGRGASDGASQPFAGRPDPLVTDTIDFWHPTPVERHPGERVGGRRASDDATFGLWRDVIEPQCLGVVGKVTNRAGTKLRKLLEVLKHRIARSRLRCAARSSGRYTVTRPPSSRPPYRRSTLARYQGRCKKLNHNHAHPSAGLRGLQRRARPGDHEAVPGSSHADHKRRRQAHTFPPSRSFCSQRERAALTCGKEALLELQPLLQAKAPPTMTACGSTLIGG